MTKFNCDKIQNTKCPVSENQQRQDWQKRTKQCSSSTSWGPRLPPPQDLKKVPEPESGFDKKSTVEQIARVPESLQSDSAHFCRDENQRVKDDGSAILEDLTKRNWIKEILIRFWSKKILRKRTLRKDGCHLPCPSHPCSLHIGHASPGALARLMF